MVEHLEQSLAPDEHSTGRKLCSPSRAPARLCPLLLTSPTCPSLSRRKNTVSRCKNPSPALSQPLLGLLALSRLSVLDLVVALAPHADETAISKLYATIRPYLEVSPGAGSPTQPRLGRRGSWERWACLHPLLLRRVICFLVVAALVPGLAHLSRRCHRDENARPCPGLACRGVWWNEGMLLCLGHSLGPPSWPDLHSSHSRPLPPLWPH